MKVLIFSLTYFPFVGGAEVAVKEITDRIPEFDWEMITVNLDGKQKSQEKIGNVLVRRIGKGKLSKYFSPLTAYKFAKKLHQKNCYDISWAIMANQAGLAALFFKLKNPQVKYLLTLQEGDSPWQIWWRTWFIWPLYKMIYQKADFIQAISNYLAKRAKKLGIKCPIKVVPNGVGIVKSQYPISNDQLNPSPTQIFFENLGGQESQIQKVITVSRLVKKNAVGDLIKAMRDVSGELLIVGGGKLRFQLEQLVRNLKIENKVKFLGEVNRNQVNECLRGADVFVRPSLSEGLGTAFLEAMACGVPIIGTPVGGIPDFLKDGETGWFCRVKDPKNIAEKINYVLNPANALVVRTVVENAKRLVVEKYNWEKIALEMKEIFQNLCSGSR